MPRLLRVIPVLALVAAFAGFTQVRLDTDTLSLLPSAVPGVAELQRLNAHLADERTLVLLVEPSDADAAEEEVAEVLDALAAVPGTHSVRDAMDGPSMEGNFAELAAYLTLNQSEAAFSRQMQALEKDKLPEILQSARRTLATTFDGLEAARAGHDPLGFTRHPVFGWLESGLAAAEEHESGVRVLLAEAEPNLAGYKDYAGWIERVRTATSGLPTRIGFTGSPAFAAEIGSAMEKDMSGTAGVCSVLVVLMFLVFQRSVRQLGALFFCLMLILGGALGMYGWAFGSLGLVSAGFAAMLVGLTVDYAMVVAREVIGAGNVSEGQAHSRKGIFWAALTTAAPFAVMMTSVMPGGSQLGFLVAVGLLIGAWVMNEWYPWLAFGAKPQTRALVLPLRAFSPRVSLRAVLGLIMLVAALILPRLGDVRMAFDVALMEPAKTEALQTLNRLQDFYPQWSQGVVHLVAHEGAALDAEKLSRAIDELKTDGIVEDALLPSGMLPDPAAFDRNTAWIAAHPQWLKDVRTALDANGFTEQAAGLPQAICEASARWGIGGVEKAFAEVKAHPLFSGRVIEDSQGRAAVGALRLTKPMDAMLHRRIRALDASGVRCASWSMVKFDIEPMLERDVRLTVLPMILALLVTLLIALRSWREALLAMGLLLLGVLVVFTLALWTGDGSLHFLQVLGLIILMGAGLDYMLHMTFALRRENGDVTRVLHGTGMAVLFCALTTAVGFGSLLMASSRAMADLGMVAGAGVMIMMMLSLLVLPGLWRRVNGK
ncbi:MAG: MMPL family transporter [Prosthecobacter sp.]